MIPENPNRYEPENGSVIATLIGWTVVIGLSPIWIPIAIYVTTTERVKNNDGQE